MSEGDGNQVRFRLRKIQCYAEKAIHDLSEVKRETSAELTKVERAAYPIIEQASFPKILTLIVDKDEYVSIRRLEGNRLKTDFDEPEDVEATKMTTFIPASLLPDDGMIGLLGTPQTFNATPTNQEDVDFLNEHTKYDEDDGWSHYCKLQHFLMGGGKYKKENWNYDESPIGITSIKKVGGKYFVRGGNSIVGAMVEEIKPNENGELEIPNWGYYWEKEEVEIQKELNNQYSIFYAVVKGSSEKEEKRTEAPATQQLASQSIRN